MKDNNPETELDNYNDFHNAYMEFLETASSRFQRSILPFFYMKNMST